ncbi:DnaA ATPase domain-containing protein [Falsiphaeobacter marinintestinus]|uniref:DnaA ATPase domain-containing protein n=1 Tax=Falsiphaeobacter marinintestinus TaxID=1492905 RepID=UPI0011B62C92|nr:DnaA/Hda family protein [Phaeobacter marinintestinus]
MHEQLSFELPARTALGREDFFVAPSNAMAVALLDIWQNWPGGKLMISGPVGSGKTHLAHVWAGATGARIIAATALNEALVPELVTGPLVVEDVHQIAEDAEAQNALFHLHNLILAERQPLLLTGQGTPAHQPFSLPDLQSRLQGTQTALLDPPDDALLSVILAKLFTDRGIVPKPDVIPYMVAHMDRSFAEATLLVERLDRTALTEKKNLSRQFVARVLNPK